MRLEKCSGLDMQRNRFDKGYTFERDAEAIARKNNIYKEFLERERQEQEKRDKERAALAGAINKVKDELRPEVERLMPNGRFIYEYDNGYRYLDAYAKQVYYKRNGDNSNFDYYEGLKKQSYEGYLREEEAKKSTHR